MNNNRYEGLWFRDYQHGRGTMYYYNGDKYVGNWKEDKRNGKGTYTYANGAYYKGDWVNDKKKEKAFLIGTTDQDMKVNGPTINETGTAFLLF